MRGALLVVTVIFTLGSSARVFSVFASNGTSGNEYSYEFPTLGNPNDTELDRFPMRDCYGFKLEEATIDILQEAMNRRHLTAQQIVSCYQQRILQTDEYLRFVFFQGAQLWMRMPP